MKTFHFLSFRYAVLFLILTISGLSLILAQTPISCNGDVNGTISSPGEVDSYTFSGISGDLVIIRMKGDLYSLDAKLELVSPSGMILISNSNSSGGVARIGNPAFSLPVSGVYTIRASDNENNDTESYGLSLQIVESDCAQLINCDGDLNANITHSAEMDAYYFSGSMGEKIIARMKGDLYSLDAALELYDPDGLLLASNTNSSSGLARLEDNSGNDVISLQKTGTYILVAMDNGGDDDEDYGISLQFLKASCALPIGCDADLNANISHSAEMDAYYFSGSMGEKIIARMKGDLYSLDAVLELYDPDGLLIASDANTVSGLARLKDNSGNDVISLQKTGTYILVAMDNDGDDDEDYGVSLQFLKASCALPIGCDADLNANISHSAEMDAYYFSGSMGEKIIARMKGDLYSLDAALELYDPDGILIASHANTVSGLARLEDNSGNDVISLQKTGTYMLVAMDNDGDDDEDYGVSLQFLKSVCALPIACDADLSANIGHSAEMDAYYFSGSMGEKIIARMKGDLYSLDAVLELYDPDGILIASDANTVSGLARLEDNSGNDLISLQKTGTYILVAMDNEGDDEEDYGISLQFLKSACALPIGCDADLSANIGHSAEMDAYYFSGSIGEKIIARMKGNLYSLDAVLELYDPDGLLVASNINTFSGLARLEDNSGNDVISLQKTGTYMLVAMDNEGDDEEDYGISLQFLKPECAIALDCHSDITGSLELDFPAQMRAFSFPVTAGTPYILQFHGNYSGADYRLEFYDEDGIEIPGLSGNVGNSDALRLQIQANQLSGISQVLVIVMEVQGDNGGYDFDLSVQSLSPSCAYLLDCGEDVLGNTTRTAEMDTYALPVQPGDRLRLRLLEADFSAQLQLEFYHADGSPWTALPMIQSNNELQAFEFSFSQYDTLLIVVSEVGINQVIDEYGLSFQLLRPACAVALACPANDQSGSLDKPAQTDAYWFEVNAGKRYIIRASGLSSGFDGVLQIISPSGNTYFASSQGMNNTFSGILDTTGNWMVIVTQEEGEIAGAYQLSFLPVGDTGCSDDLLCGQFMTGTVFYKTSMRQYRINGLEGKKIITRARGVSGSALAVKIEGYTADGQPAGVPATGNPARWEQNFNPEGEFFLVISDNNTSNTGNFNISYQVANDFQCGQAISYNQYLTGSLTAFAEMNGFVFTGAANEVVTTQFGVCSPSFDAQIELWDATGLLQKFDVTDNGLARIDTFRLPVSGQYKLLVMEKEGDETAAGYGISLQKVNPGINAGVLSIGVAYNGSILQAAEMQVFTFSGGQGDPVLLDINDLSGNLISRMELFAPNGERIAAGSSNTNINLVSMPQSGIYTVLVLATNTCGSGNFSLELKPVLNVSTTFLSHDGGSGSTAFDIGSNCQDWTTTVSPASAADWLTVVPESGNGSSEVSVVFTYNPTPNTRNATITVTGCGISKTISVSQAGATLFVTPTFVNVGNLEGDATLEINGTCEGTWSISGAPDWIDVLPSSGNGPATVILLYGENQTPEDRTATLTLTGCGSTTTIYITQAGFNSTINVNPAFINAPENAGSDIVVISGTCSSWTITGAPSWLQVSPTNGSGEALVTLTYTANPGTNSRTAILTLTGCGSTFTITLVQAGNTTSTDEINGYQVLSLTPNPATDAFTVEIPVDFPSSRLLLFSMEGRLCRSFETRGGQFILVAREFLPGGVYLLQVVAENGQRLAAGKVVLTD